MSNSFTGRFLTWYLSPVIRATGSLVPGLVSKLEMSKAHRVPASFICTLPNRRIISEVIIAVGRTGRHWVGGVLKDPTLLPLSVPDEFSGLAQEDEVDLGKTAFDPYLGAIWTEPGQMRLIWVRHCGEFCYVRQGFISLPVSPVMCPKPRPALTSSLRGGTKGWRWNRGKTVSIQNIYSNWLANYNFFEWKTITLAESLHKNGSFL